METKRHGAIVDDAKKACELGRIESDFDKCRLKRHFGERSGLVGCRKAQDGNGQEIN